MIDFKDRRQKTVTHELNNPQEQSLIQSEIGEIKLAIDTVLVGTDGKLVNAADNSGEQTRRVVVKAKFSPECKVSVLRQPEEIKGIWQWNPGLNEEDGQIVAAQRIDYPNNTPTWHDNSQIPDEIRKPLMNLGLASESTVGGIFKVERGEKSMIFLALIGVPDERKNQPDENKVAVKMVVMEGEDLSNVTLKDLNVLNNAGIDFYIPKNASRGDKVWTANRATLEQFVDAETDTLQDRRRREMKINSLGLSLSFCRRRATASSPYPHDYFPVECQAKPIEANNLKIDVLSPSDEPRWAEGNPGGAINVGRFADGAVRKDLPHSITTLFRENYPDDGSQRHHVLIRLTDGKWQRYFALETQVREVTDTTMVKPILREINPELLDEAKLPH
jgi:hypothetical protein